MANLSKLIMYLTWNLFKYMQSSSCFMSRLCVLFNYPRMNSVKQGTRTSFCCLWAIGKEKCDTKSSYFEVLYRRIFDHSLSKYIDYKKIKVFFFLAHYYFNRKLFLTYFIYFHLCKYKHYAHFYVVWNEYQLVKNHFDTILTLKHSVTLKLIMWW